MKKLVYFFGIFALIAGLVTSCGDDDDDDEGNGNSGGKTVSQKKLKKLVEDNYYWEYTYDKDGRCTSYSEFYQNQFSEKTNYKYEGNKIVEECYEQDGEVRTTTTILFNSKGYVESVTTDNSGSLETMLYEYDNQGHLISEKYSDDDGDTRISTYTWENGNISKIETREKHGESEYGSDIYLEYTNDSYPNGIENKVRINYLEMDDEFLSPYLRSAGVAIKKLPVTLKYIGDERSSLQTLTWTLDSDGYPIKIVSGYDSDTDTFEFVWE